MGNDILPGNTLRVFLTVMNRTRRPVPVYRFWAAWIRVGSRSGIRGLISPFIAVTSGSRTVSAVPAMTATPAQSSVNNQAG